jgi:hypothetical protein
MVVSAFPRLGSYSPVDLPRSLSQLEQNVALRFAQLSALVQQMTVTGLNTATCLANFRQIVRVDPSGGGFTVVLPDPGAFNAGPITIYYDSSSATGVTINVAAGTIKRTSVVFFNTPFTALRLYPNTVDRDWMIV